MHKLLLVSSVDYSSKILFVIDAFSFFCINELKLEGHILKPVQEDERSNKLIYISEEP